jgi:ABC-type multidrug transport system fused ATPase/permease subunit
MFTENVKIGQILLLSFVIVTMLNYFGGNYLIRIVAEREIYMNEDVNQNIQNTVDNLMNIYINNETKAEVNKNLEKEKKATVLMNNIMFWENVTITTSHFIILIAYAISLYYVYGLLMKKKIKSGAAIVIILLLGEYMSYGMDLTSGFIHSMIYKLGIIKSAKHAVEELLVDNKDRTKKNVIKRGNIVFRYKKDSDEVLFDELNLKIEGGTRMGIMGRSGSGKTTLMKMLVGLYKPEEGKILIDGVDTNTMDLEYLRTEVNYLNQKTQLFEESILYNMKYGNNKSEKEIKDKLKQYGLLEVFSDLPDGVEANAGLNGGNLSGGMQKVTILMRGILKPGRIIILDEPLAGLDKNTISKVINMIMKETKGKTVLVITHDNAILPYMDNVVNINELH